jgi:glutathione S-transferase
MTELVSWQQSDGEAMLELYHNINSVCAQKVRLVLNEKGLECKEHLMTLRGDQFEPAYVKLNPNAVVPTLIHNGQPIIESSIILYYLDEAFPERPLMPGAPLARARVRQFTKLIDDVHNSCTILTFAMAFRPGLLRLSPEAREAGYAKSPNKKRVEFKRDVVANGLDSVFVKEALEQHDKLLASIDEATKAGPYLAGDTYSLADAATIPYILRLELLRLSRLWDKRPDVGAWWRRMRERPSTQAAILGRMTEADAAPFQAINTDPWPKVQELLAAA